MRNIEAFVFDLLYERASKIVPPDELVLLPATSDFEKSWVALSGLIFVIEKFLNSRIPVLKYTIVESSSYDESGLDDDVATKLNKFKKMLLTADINLNNDKEELLPNSSKCYFIKKRGIDTPTYNVDFINQFFGIKHAHINTNRKQDILLYYVIYGTEIYFVKIGKHADLYEQDMVENLVNEFPNLIHHIGIGAMPDMPATNHKYSPEAVKKNWIAGGNVSYVINGKYYTSFNPQTLSRLNTQAVRITQEILYQSRSYYERFNEHLKSLYPKLNQDFEIEPLIYDREENIIEIGSRVTKDACEIKIDYLRRLKLTDTYIGANIIQLTLTNLCQKAKK